MTESLVKAKQDLRQGNLKQALEEFREIVASDPQNALAFQGQGSALSRLRRFDEAILAYRRALELDPSLAIPHANLGVIYRIRRQVAESEFKQAIELDPTLLETHLNFGYLLAFQGRLGEAQTVIDRAIQLDPTRSECYTALFSVHLRGRRFGDAVQAARRAFSLAPSLSTCRSVLFMTMTAFPPAAMIPIAVIVLIGINGRSAINFTVAVAWASLMLWNSFQAIRIHRRRDAAIFALSGFIVLEWYTTRFLS